jgi:hypothetical protein
MVAAADTMVLAEGSDTATQLTGIEIRFVHEAKTREARFRLFQAANDYLRLTRDKAFLTETLENGKTVLQCLDDLATDWETLPENANALAARSTATTLRMDEW